LRVEIEGPVEPGPRFALGLGQEGSEVAGVVESGGDVVGGARLLLVVLDVPCGEGCFGGGDLGVPRSTGGTDRRYAMDVKPIEDQIAGALLLSARTRLGLSQTAFAELLGIAQPTLSAYESGRRQPTLPTLLRLLSRAGLDLRMELTEQDRHDDVLAEWERSLDARERARLEAQGYRLVTSRG
jgi:transcriptional regulator with XRE-family HTH domain